MLLREAQLCEIGDLSWYRTVAERDVREVISEPTTITLDGRPIAVFDRYHGARAPHLLHAVRSLKYPGVSPGNARTEGLSAANTITFGYMPRNPIRHNYCRECALAHTKPQPNEELHTCAQHLTEGFLGSLPEQGAAQAAIVQAAVLPEWRLSSLFTSGIVNRDNQLPYHRDAGNFEGCWSAMVVFTFDMRGGLLNVPELGVAFDFSALSPAVIYFDGQRFLHGVTPIHKRSRLGFRYSIVCYALKNMRFCLPCKEEIAYARTWRTQSEQRRKDGKDPPRKRKV